MVGAEPITVEITRHALDRVPLSLIVDDSTVVFNLNYFWLRDRIEDTGEWQRWEDLPVTIPESFTREFATWCADSGVRGKYSVVPVPAGLGRIDRPLPLLTRTQQARWLAMCREMIVPNFDITPEMLTHTRVLDIDTLQPLPGPIWEQREWVQFPEQDAEYIGKYIALACEILANVGLPPEGVTSPGGFGGKSLPLYARLAGEAVRRVTGNPIPYFFKQVLRDGRVDAPVWYGDRDSGTAVGEVIACIGDFTGSWTGYGEVDADKYITEDLQGGRLPEVIGNGDPCVLVSHWQGFYGLYDGDRRGFRALQTVVERLRALDPTGERTRWVKPSEITAYAIAREMATIDVFDEADTDAGEVHIALDLPVRAPDLTMRVAGAATGRIREIRWDGTPLTSVSSRAALRAGTLLRGEDSLIAVVSPQRRQSRLTLSTIPAQ